jgi:hypothetical protein
MSWIRAVVAASSPLATNVSSTVRAVTSAAGRCIRGGGIHECRSTLVDGGARGPVVGGGALTFHESLFKAGDLLRRLETVPDVSHVG